MSPSFDIRAAFAQLWESEGGKEAIAVGGLMYLLFPLLLIPPLVATGWQVEYGRMVSRGETELPRWRLGQAGIGLRLIAVGIGYFLPIYLLLAPFMVFLFAADESQASAAFGIFFAAAALANVFSLAVQAILPAVYAVFISENRIASCFRPTLIRNAMRPFGWSYLVAPLLIFAAGMVAGFGILLCIIGVFFTVFWSQAVSMHLAGQLARTAAAARI